MTPTPDLTEDVLDDGYRVFRHKQPDDLLTCQYVSYNEHTFGGALPGMPIYLAKRIANQGGSHVNAVYVSERLSNGNLLRYIALDERLDGMFPLDRLCLLHEMVHVKLEPLRDHGQEFRREFQRVLDVNGWEPIVGSD